ncbi:hypothetical protein KQQSB11_10037 [Klebsiella quasipneumoniae subsp. quasipneumoniae]|nr:hypothetical protein KQQSB11_10037 [Klebsiella quasipneumoniae subsp. quasipneumoniae]
MVSFLSNAVESTQCLIKAVVSSVEIKSTLFSTLSGALKNGAVGKRKIIPENSHPLRTETRRIHGSGLCGLYAG